MKPVACLAAMTATLLVSATWAQDVPPPDPELPPEQPYSPETDTTAPTFYVGLWGSLTTTWHNNTAQNPFVTLDQARLQVRDYIAVNGPQPVKVVIGGGAYPLSGPVTFTAADSGQVGARISYQSWNPGGIGGVNNDDVLFSGGYKLTGWAETCPGSNTYVCTIPANVSVKVVRDVWVNNQRMIKARFPNLVTSCGTAYADPITPPCPNVGYLLVEHVSAMITGGKQYQVVRVRTPNGTPFPPIADSSWSQVEASATRFYVNAHQRVFSGYVIPDAPDRAVLTFGPLRSWTSNPSSNYLQELGALGVFYYRNWDPLAPCGDQLPGQQDYLTVRGYLQMVGEMDLARSCPSPYNIRSTPAQVFLTGAVEFLDTQNEWYYNTATRQVYLSLCHNPDTAGDSVIIPVAPQLLVIDGAQNLDFFNLDWAYTRQNLPLMADGLTQGYVSVQSGVTWDDAGGLGHNNITLGAVTMLGARNIGFRACRVAHTGGSGVIVSTKEDGGSFYESNSCQVSQCEIFDIGAHGVYVGDEYSPNDPNWVRYDLSGAGHDPSNDLWVERCKIQNFAVVYRDSVGIYAGHTRDVNILDNEVSYGNYDGINVGTGQAHHLSINPPPVCGPNATSAVLPPPATIPNHCDPGHNVVVTPITVPQNTEGTKINRCDIHHVMMRLSDGGAIYMQGSHIGSLDGMSHPPPNNSGRCSSGELNGNYIHDIVLNPFINPPASGYLVQYTCQAFYFEGGSDTWHVLNNYVERVQGPYTFASGFSNDHNCERVPTVIWCGCSTSPTSPQPAIHWQQTAWPQRWLYLDGTTWIPGQLWYAGAPNFWLYAPGGAYGDYINGWPGTNAHSPYGYGFPNDPNLSGFGGMYMETRMWNQTGNVGNVLVTDPAQGGQPLNTTLKAAGPDDNVPNWFYPSVVKRIHRSPLCGQTFPIDPSTQIQ